MEARRKEREEEKARLREEKAKQKEETENKVSTDSQESRMIKFFYLIDIS